MTGVSGRVITVVEGNKNNAVETRFVNVSGRYIRGFGLPDYASKLTVEVQPAPKPKTIPKCPYAEPSRDLRRGSKGNGVRWVQWHLNFSGIAGDKLAVDGGFGVKTRAAVLKFQMTKKLTQDGIVGVKTRAALKRAVR